MLTLSSASVLLVTSIIPPLFAKKTEQGLDALSQIKGFQTVLSWLFGQGAWGQNNGLVVAGTIPAWALYSISAWILPQTMLKAARQIYAALNEKCLLPVLSVIATALILTLYQGVETVSGMGLAGLTRNITDTCSKMALPNATAANITGPFPCYGQAANDTFLATWLLLNLYKMVESVMTMATAAMISAGSIVNGCGGVALYFYIAAKQTAEMSFFTAFCICQGIFSASKANTANTDDIIDMAKLKAVLDKALIAKQFAGEGDDRKLILVPEKKDEAGKVVSEQIVLDPAAIMKAFPEKLSKYNLFSFGNSGGVQQPLLGLGSPRTYGKKRVS
ncbi:MAG: hypothetical protein NTU49_04810, partial [Gammaproteobacteria bacterium]|nr:hypothetical protein [Gammaproteobacteria bacterium]